MNETTAHYWPNLYRATQSAMHDFPADRHRIYQAARALFAAPEGTEAWDVRALRGALLRRVR